MIVRAGKADAGVTWQSEVAFRSHGGHSISAVDIPAEQNATATCAGAGVKPCVEGAKTP